MSKKILSPVIKTKSNCIKKRWSMTYALCIHISLSSAYSRYRRDSAETSSSTGSRAWTDLNLEQRHDCNAPLRGNFICRPSRPWASSASRGRFENHPIFEPRVCIIDRWRRRFIIAGDRTLLRNSLPSPSSTSFLSSILFQLPLSFLRTFDRYIKSRFDPLFVSFSVSIVSFYHPCDKSMMLRDRVSRVRKTIVRREWNWRD